MQEWSAVGTESGGKDGSGAEETVQGDGRECGALGLDVPVWVIRGWERASGEEDLTRRVGGSRQ